MKKFVNSFPKGMDTDTSVNKYSNLNYFKAINLRLTSEDSLSNGALSLIDGTVAKASFKDLEVLLGNINIRDTMFVCAYHPDGGRIYKFVDDGSTGEQIPVLIYTHSKLKFYEDYPVFGIGRYETPDIQKIYFSDGEHFFYQLNTVSDTYPISTTSVPVEQLEIVSNVKFSPIETEIVPGGNLPTGRVQYSYQFYNKNGSETVFSPTSSLISITESSEGSIDTYDYLGSDKGVFANKSVNVTVQNNDSVFSRLRVVALTYESYNQTPDVRIVGEYDISDKQTIDILDSGQSIGELTLEEFRFMQSDFYPKSFETKDNIMVAGNIKYNHFDISDKYDTRAFRWKNTTGTTSSYFDVSDSLVYKVTGGSFECKIKDGNNNYTILEDLSNLSNIDITNECFNTYNDLAADIASGTNEYKYNPDTGELGGKGKYISYRFVTKKVLLDNNIKVYDYKMGYPRVLSKVSNPIENYANPLTEVGYQRDEIYRFAFLPRDLKGRPGFANWIGDIRFPNHVEMPFITYEEGKTYANILGIEFTVDLESDNIAQELKESISGYSIVRAERDSSNTTIITQGVVSYISKTHQDGSFDNSTQMGFSAAATPYLYECYNKSLDQRRSEHIPNVSENNEIVQSGGVILNPNHVEFISPSVAFNKKINSLSDAKIEIIGYLGDKIESYVTQVDEASILYDKYCSFTGSQWNDQTRFKALIGDYKIFTPQSRANNTNNSNADATRYVLNDDFPYNNQCIDYRTSRTKMGQRGTFLMCSLNASGIPGTLNIPNNNTFTGASEKAKRVLFANIRINKGRTIYGGTGYEDRKNTTYYSASEIFGTAPGGKVVFGGDTYINTFVYLRAIYDQRTQVAGHRLQSMLAFPVESKINLDLRLDNIQRYTQWGRPDKTHNSEIISHYALTEKLSDGVQDWGATYPTDVGDLYRYNPAYSTEDKSFAYTEKPFDFVSVKKVDTRITASEKKLNGEYVDSWLKFKFNNILDVDSEYHGITRLLNVNNNIYFFQPKAVGVVAINDRSLIPDNSASKLALGTGGVLERFDYLTTNSGASSYHDITKSDKTFYYVDKLRKRMYVYTSTGDEPISILKGINSYMTNLTYDSIEVEYDPQYSEVLANIDGTMIVYNELIKAFTSLYTYDPDRMFRLGGQLYIVKQTPESGDTNIVLWNENDYALWDEDPISRVLLRDGNYSPPVLYKLNAGSPGNFYKGGIGTNLSCSVTLIINPNGNIVNYFDNIDIRTDVTDINGNDVGTETISSIEASNNYQNFTKELTYSTDKDIKGNIEKIARIWRTTLMPSTSYNNTKRRMVDTYLKLKINYNSTDKRFKLHDIITYYRETKL